MSLTSYNTLKVRTADALVCCLSWNVIYLSMQKDKNEILIDVCSQYDVPYIDLYDLELFNRHPEYFRDPGHLNDKGAHIYTELFFKHLKPYLEEL